MFQIDPNKMYTSVTINGKHVALNIIFCSLNGPIMKSAKT